MLGGGRGGGAVNVAALNKSNRLQAPLGSSLT